MKYEHLGIDMSHDACDHVQRAVRAWLKLQPANRAPAVVIELENFANNLRSRLQREDSDPKATLPSRSASAPVADDAWLG